MTKNRLIRVFLALVILVTFQLITPKNGDARVGVAVGQNVGKGIAGVIKRWGALRVKFQKLSTPTNKRVKSGADSVNRQFDRIGFVLKKPGKGLKKVQNSYIKPAKTQVVYSANMAATPFRIASKKWDNAENKVNQVKEEQITARTDKVRAKYADAKGHIVHKKMIYESRFEKKAGSINDRLWSSVGRGWGKTSDTLRLDILTNSRFVRFLNRPSRSSVRAIDKYQLRNNGD